MNKSNSIIYKQYISDIEKYLLDFCQNDNCIQKSVIDAMRYSLMAGGKRIRPVLMLEFYKVCGGKNNIMPIACSIEMIHTFSLIHDDLPCMDNDDFRRGKPSCHKQYDEAIALLAGDALNTVAFEVISGEALSKNISYKTAVKLIKELSRAVGVCGMIGGQVIDIEHDNKPIDIEALKTLDRLKTGELIKAAVKMGCILADSDNAKMKLAQKYAQNIGLAFQIIDDILDVTSTFDKLGKPINSDKCQQKTTFVSVYGFDKARLIADDLTKEALDILEQFDDNSFLIDMTKMLLSRDN